MSGKICCVVGCHNSSNNFKKWQNSKCEEHVDFLHKDCPCLQPFKLHRFPKNCEIRREWISAINRKDFKPTDHSVVCSLHFVDGHPTQQNPNPQICLGYVKKVVLGRRVLNRCSIEEMSRCKHSKVEASCIAMSKENDSSKANGNKSSTTVVEIQEDASFTSNEEPNSCELAKAFVTCGTQTDIQQNVSIGCQVEDTSLLDHSYEDLTKSRLISRGTNVNFPECSYDDLNEKDSKFLTGLKLNVFLTLVSIMAKVGKSPHRMELGNQILLVLMRLRLGLLFADLGRRFRISKSLANSIFNYWLPVMAKTLSELVCWLPRETIRNKIPNSFKALYPKTTCIIDCSEIFIQRPHNLRARAQTFSNYKSHNTAKFLIAIAPHGYCMFVSQCYGGRASDKFIVNNSGFLDFLLPGDEVMADRGFTIEEALLPRRVALNIPAFTKGKKQLSEVEVTQTRRIASVRIHVERAIERIKQYRLLKYTLPLKGTCASIDNLVITCAALTNLHSLLIKNGNNSVESV